MRSRYNLSRLYMHICVYIYINQFYPILIVGRSQACFYHATLGDRQRRRLQSGHCAVIKSLGNHHIKKKWQESYKTCQQYGLMAIAHLSKNSNRFLLRVQWLMIGKASISKLPQHHNVMQNSQIDRNSKMAGAKMKGLFLFALWG